MTIDEDIDECPICMDNQSDIVTDCGHQLCHKCHEHINIKKICHMCRHKICDFFIIKIY